jgi:hypothetical protein
MDQKQREAAVAGNGGGFRFWQSSRILRHAFSEHVACVRDVHARAARYLTTPESTPAEFRTGPGPIPDDVYTVRRNLFSTLFMAVYFLLDISPARRALFGRLNQLFRIWVTSADNLLDGEDKTVLPMHMPGSSRVMRQVVAVMAADRILTEFLDEAVTRGVISSAQSDRLLEQSIRTLLPSAAQEGSEEGGIVSRPPPEYVLWTIHRLKTGLLFQLPFLGPETVEEGIDPVRLVSLKKALLHFGLGCQLLDDIRDLARDLAEKRQNYVLSSLAHTGSPLLEEWTRRNPPRDARLYLQHPQAVLPAAQRGIQLMHEGLTILGQYGLGLPEGALRPMADHMVGILDLEGLAYG